MAARMSSGSSDLAKIVEKQMRNWELARAQRVAPAPDASEPEVASFVSISRSVGTGGRALAKQLGERLNWPVFDREILQAMAGDDQVRARLYEELDERDTSWLEATLRWLTRGEMRTEDYFRRLTETVLALARQGHAVFLGRGADLILPRDRGLRVRVTASLERRVEALALRRNLPHNIALAEVERVDRERDDFRRQHFGKSADDLTCWDLIINLDQLTMPFAVDAIVLALRSRGELP